MIKSIPHLHELHEVIKILLLINGQFAVVVDNAVMLHLAVTADTQGVVTRVVGALPHQEEARFRGIEEPFCLLTRDLSMKPSEVITNKRDAPCPLFRCDMNVYFVLKQCDAKKSHLKG